MPSGKMLLRLVGSRIDEGHSAVIRRAVADSLRKKRRATIAAAYRRAYGKQPAESDLSGWADEGLWPDE